MLAQVVFHGMGVGGIAIEFIILVAIVAVVLVICRAMEVPVPGWIITIAWILLAAFVGILAVRLLMSM